MNATSLEIPESKEGFICTLNGYGYMTEELDYFMQKFIDFASSSQEPSLDIGAAYGVATIPAINRGTNIIANDLDERHLEIIRARTSQSPLLKTISGDFRLANIEVASLRSILIARVIHFFRGNEINDISRLFYNWLKPGGKVFLTAETPYLKNWTSFIPVYEKRKANKELWPGLVDPISDYVINRNADLPEFIHFLDVETLNRTFVNAGFVIEELRTFPRPEFPSDMQHDGRESVGLIALRP